MNSLRERTLSRVLLTVSCFSLCFIAFTCGRVLLARQQTAGILTVGFPLAISGEAWGKPSNGTLVLVLSTTCPYSKQSAPFYNQILSTTSSDTTHILAAFQEPPDEGRKFLKSLGLGAITDVRQVDFKQIRTRPTPTIIFADRQGRVVSAWTGLPRRESQLQILHAAKSLTSGQPSLSTSSAALNVEGPPNPKAGLELERDLHISPNLTVIDIRDRAAFNERHLAMAKNIPADEIQIRSQHEVSRSQPIRLYCEFRDICLNPKVAGSTSLCESVRKSLVTEGFNDVKVIEGGLTDLSRAGFAVKVAAGSSE